MVTFRTFRPNQFLGWDFFCRFLQQDGSKTFSILYKIRSKKIFVPPGQHQRTRGAASVQQLEVSIEHLKEQLRLSHERQKQMDIELKQQMSQSQQIQEKYERYHSYIT